MLWAISPLAHAVAVESYPNTEAKARLHASGNVALYNHLVAQGKACITPGFRFYQQKFGREFHTAGYVHSELPDCAAQWKYRNYNSWACTWASSLSCCCWWGKGAMVVSKRTPSGYMAHDDFIPILTSLMNCLCLKFANSDITTKQY